MGLLVRWAKSRPLLTERCAIHREQTFLHEIKDSAGAATGHEIPTLAEFRSAPLALSLGTGPTPFGPVPDSVSVSAWLHDALYESPSEHSHDRTSCAFRFGNADNCRTFMWLAICPDLSTQQNSLLRIPTAEFRAAQIIAFGLGIFFHQFDANSVSLSAWLHGALRTDALPDFVRIPPRQWELQGWNRRCGPRWLITSA
jgi:hypothetical protein